MSAPPKFLARLVPTQWDQTYMIVPIDPDLVIGGGPIIPPPVIPPDPNAPHPEHPIMLPGMPGWGQWPNVPTHPIMLPGMPGWPKPPVPPSPGPGVNAIVLEVPPQDPPVPPPAGLPPDSVQMLVWFGPGTKPAVAWIQPYASTGPVTPPTTPPPA